MTGATTDRSGGAKGDDSFEDMSFLDMPGHLLRRCQQIAVAVFLEECRAFDLSPI